MIITGHSLGGSLAGFIGSLTGTETVVFNEIPYLGLALTASLDTFFSTLTIADDPKQIADTVLDALKGEGLTINGFRLPMATSVTSYRMDGEVAALARVLGPFLGIPTNLLIDKLRGADAAQVDAIAAAVSRIWALGRWTVSYRAHECLWRRLAGCHQLAFSGAYGSHDLRRC